ncbi:MAG TPA: homoserine kinase [Acidobacteriota bacterium]|nr:homoserine kinase [Acidobacteriota bacterium]
MEQRVRAFAPATVSNLACAFDIVGFAVDEPGDEVEVGFAEGSGAVIGSISGDGGRLPRLATKNTATVAVNALLDHLGERRGLVIDLHKQMPLGSGLGSSAASAAAALWAANGLLGSPLDARSLLPFALAAEEAACGTGHADNAAPSLLGGMVLIRSYDPLDVIDLPYPPELYVALVTPQLEIRTGDARRLLADSVPLSKAVTQWGNVAGLIAGLHSGDYKLIGRSLVDVVIEPQRAALLPGFYRVQKAALEAGALGCSLSGSGPTLFALCRGKSCAAHVAEAMRLAFADLDTPSEARHSAINPSGARILEGRLTSEARGSSRS